jgi:hypothetical protein
VSDMQDPILNSKEWKVFAVQRSDALQNLKCIPVYLNEFGLKGGYDSILTFFKEVSQGKKVTLQHIFYIVDFVGKTQPLLHKQFAVYFIPKFS